MVTEFNNIFAHSIVRVAAASPRVHLANPHENARETIALMQRAHEGEVALLVCPELGLSGYSLDDLHMQTAHSTQSSPLSKISCKQVQTCCR